MKKIEIIGKRKPNEKHFLQDDGTFVAEMYENNIHFLQDGHYEEIDNTLIKKDNYYTNNKNGWRVLFPVNSSHKFMRIEKNEKYVDFYIKNNNEYEVSVENTKNKISSKITFNNIFNYIDIQYVLEGSKIKENIIINSIDFNARDLCFYIKTNLDLFMEEDHKIIIKDGKYNIFYIDKPFIIDCENNVCNNCKYEITKGENGYLLKLNIDEKWCKENKHYPLIIDPTISELINESSLIDTYIFQNDTNFTRGNLEYLKVGVERQNGNDIINRALLKFDLPLLGTGSQVINATLNIKNYPYVTSSIFYEKIDIHRVTNDWTELGANWNNMNNSFDSRVEGAFNFRGIYYINPDTHNPIIISEIADITSLVQKWYTGEPNYGILLKLSKEEYKNDLIPLFISKDFQNYTGDSPKPILSITYRNQNGLENYMNYEYQKLQNGGVYHNVYNGNLTHILNLASTKAGKMPVDLQLVYNTNDVVLNNNIGYGIGYRLNLSQLVKEVIIDNKKYLEYTDQDGTLHYFLNERIELVNGVNQTVIYENKYFDEDNLNLIIEKESTKYIMKDKNNNIKEFSIVSDIGYLTKIQDAIGNTNIISYDNENRIVSVEDANNQYIYITYSHNPSLVINVFDSNNCGVRLQYVSNSLMEVDFLKRTLTDYMIYYCENHLIKTITDINGKKLEYQYYANIPYKVKKVIEYGLNNTIGNYYDVRYGFNETSLIDRKNHIKSIVFNNQGNTKSIALLKSANYIVDAYGKQGEYVDITYSAKKDLNKKMEDHPIIKSVINLFENSSFEGSQTIFTPDSNTVLSINNVYPHYGLQCLKIEPNGITNTYRIEKNIIVETGNYYTFSGFLKVIDNNASAKISIKYTDNDLIEHEEFSSNTSNNEYERLDSTIYIPSDLSNNTITLSVIITGSSICYLDDIQLEKSQVLNDYNLIENSDFRNGYSDWSLTSSNDSITDVFDTIIENGQTMLKVKMNTSNETTFSKEFNIKGKMHDKLSLSFWFKNNGLCGGLDEIGSEINNNVTIIYYPEDEEMGGDSAIETFQLNPCEDEWQFFTYNFEAFYDYKKVKLIFAQTLNANDFYITNINLFKNLPIIKYKYDASGNLIQTKKLNNGYIEYKYSPDNEIISLINQKDSKLYYEYDIIKTDRIINGIADNGLTNEIKYDIFGNPIIYRIINKKTVINFHSGTYSIRLKGTSTFCTIKNNGIYLNNDTHLHNKWNFESVNIESKEYFKISHTLIENKYFSVINNSLVLSEYNIDNSLFEIIKTENGSFLIKNRNTGKYIKNNNYMLSVSDLNQDDNNFYFYFEEDSNDFIENSVSYDIDGKYITSNINPELTINKYNVNNEGIIISVIDYNGEITSYLHDIHNRIIQVSDGTLSSNFEYSNNLLTKIYQHDREYNFVYDDYMNLISIKIGDDIVLYTNSFDQYNGNLIKTQFANGQENLYEYDDFDRLKKVTRNDDVYYYLYNNNGYLSKIISNNILKKYLYDNEKRLYKYNNNNFSIRYEYDNNENIIRKDFSIDNITFLYKNILDNNDKFMKTEFDNKEILYEYDELGRIININVDNSIETEYIYQKNGKRSTMLIKDIYVNGNIYSYRYNKNNKITHIFYNNNLKMKYYYDKCGELIREDNFENNVTTRYYYDEYSNLRYIKDYKLCSFDLIMQKKFRYNNSNWVDQLTSVDDKSLSYDLFGNVTNIGNNITMTWSDGKNLSSYSDGNNLIQYKYDYNDLRYKKIINNIETDYYYENKSLIIEKTNNNVIYYIRDNNNDLVGFNYSGDNYYYVKNIQNDILQIVNTNNVIVAKYTYDSWGNIISITDGNDNDVSNNDNHIANINPFRYRSYYYDKETNLYYLKSRYYSPYLCRFLSIDDYINANKDIISNNIYIYCSNDPINNIDFNGKGLLKIVSKIAKTVVKVYNTLKATVTKLANSSASHKKNEKTKIPTMQKAPDYPDYSEELDRVLIRNTAISEAVSNNTTIVETLAFFSAMEYKRQPWDYKESVIWNAEFKNNYLGVDGPFLYHGKVTTAEDYGNIHYGYVGSALGIPPEILFMAGGIVKCKIDPKVLQPPLYCDDENDHEAIQRGIDMYYGLTN